MSVIPRECKRLAEVDFPIAVVSKHAAREKSIRHGHPSTLHLWWARRPLASSRAVLLALLLPDPCDPRCPEAFKAQATEILTAVRKAPKHDEELRQALLWFIGAFANWDTAAHPTYLRVGRGLVRAAHGKENAPGGRPLRGRGVDSAGGAPARLRGVRERPEPRGVPDTQGDAGGTSRVTDRDSPTSSAAWAARSRRRPRGIWPTSIRRTPTAPRRSPTSGRARCAAKRRTAGRRSRSCARSGCARRPAGSGRSGTACGGPRARRREWISRSSNRERTGRYRTGRSRAPERRASAAAPCCPRSGCGRNSPRSGVARTSCLTRQAGASAGLA